MSAFTSETTLKHAASICVALSTWKYEEETETRPGRESDSKYRYAVNEIQSESEDQCGGYHLRFMK